MPEYKTVYFAPDGKWFETHRECEDYEELQRMCDWIWGFNGSESMLKRLMARYKIEERYDYVADEEGEQA